MISLCDQPSWLPAGWTPPRRWAQVPWFLALETRWPVPGGLFVWISRTATHRRAPSGAFPGSAVTDTDRKGTPLVSVPRPRACPAPSPPPALAGGAEVVAGNRLGG